MIKLQDKDICIVCNYPCYYGSKPCTFCNLPICSSWQCSKGYWLTHLHNVCKFCQDNQRIQQEIKYLYNYESKQRDILKLEINNLQKNIIGYISTKSEKEPYFGSCTLCDKVENMKIYVCFLCDEYRCAYCTRTDFTLIWLCNNCKNHSKLPEVIKEIVNIDELFKNQIDNQDALNLKTVIKLKCELGFALIDVESK